MASRSIWKGTLSFGMVVMPVKVYNSTTDSRKETAMVNLHLKCRTRLKQPKFCPTCETQVEMSEVIKGFEIGKEQYIEITENDLASLPLPSSGAVQIDTFVADLPDDPRFVKDTYFIMPDKVGNKAFFLFTKAMRDKGVVGVSKIGMRSNSKETLCFIRPWEKSLVLQTVKWPEELKDTGEFQVPEVELTDKESQMAGMLIQSMTGQLDLSQFTDSYADAFRKMVEAKLEGKTIEPVQAKKETDDIMEALERSLAATASAA